MAHQTCHYKLVLLGDTAVGKSCLVIRFVRNEFFEFQEPTIGGSPPLNFMPFCISIHKIKHHILFGLLSAAFLTQTITLDDYTVKFEIWDTAGQGPALFWIAFFVTLVGSMCCRLLDCFPSQSVRVNNVYSSQHLASAQFYLERYRSLAPMYYRGAMAAIVVYDVTNPVGIFWFYVCT